MKFSQFKGMTKKVAPGRLGEGIANHAQNSSFERGALMPLARTIKAIELTDLKPTVIGTVGTLRGLFYSHQADAYFGFANVVRRGIDSLIAPQDQYRRIYFADQTGVRYMTGDQYTNDAVNLSRTSYRLGIPAPANGPSASRTSMDIPADVNGDDVVFQRVYYVFTMVDQYGHEGPPSLASNGVNVPIEYPFSVAVTVPHSGSDINGRAFGSGAVKRIYRSTSGTSGEAFQYVGQVGFSSTTYNDSVEYGDEGEVIPTDTWYAPPAEIKEIDAIASNFLAGFYDNMVCFSEVKLPHAWPYEYRFPLKFEVVAIQSTANGLFIGTTGKPYWAFGADPQAAVPQELDYDYPCIDRNSVADVGGLVVYASHDGLVAVDGSSAQLLTGDLFTEAGWKELTENGIVGFSFESRYFFRANGQTYTLLPGDPTSLTVMALDPNVRGGLDDFVSSMRNIKADRSVIVSEDSLTPLMEVVSEVSDNALYWVSDSILTGRQLFTTLRVKASLYPIEITVTTADLAGTALGYGVYNVEDENPVRLKPGPPASMVQFIIRVQNPPENLIIFEVDIVQSVQELR